MKNLINLWVEERNGEKIIIYQTAEREEKLDNEYSAIILSKMKLAGRLEHPLTMMFIKELLER